MYRHRHIHRVRISFRFAFCENGNEKTDEKRSFIAHFTFLLRHFQRVIVLSVGLWLPFVCSSPQIGKSIENSLSELEYVAPSIHSSGDKLSAMIMNFMINDFISYSANMKMNRIVWLSLRFASSP